MKQPKRWLLDVRLGLCAAGISAAGAASCTCQSGGLASSETSAASTEQESADSARSAGQPSAVTHGNASEEASTIDGTPAHKECSPGMVLIQGGTFRMGDPFAVMPDDDHFRHDVALRSFCMDAHQVTVAEYRACVEKGACAVPHDNGVSCTYGQSAKGNHPINCVDYLQAKQACEALGKRLPTEEEWEYAARGGSEARTYSWGEEQPSKRLSCYDHHETCPVDAHPAGAFGLLGMTGNVWEWTSSPFVKYAGWIPSDEWRVYRGGSYSRRFPKWMKTWIRNRFRTDEWGAHLGFRCVVDLGNTTCPGESAPLANDPTRCLLPGEKLPRTPVPTGHGSADDNAPPPVVTRSPSFDADCQRYKPSTPIAYDVRGSSFAQRQKVKSSRGCSNRDVGGSFNSICCPQ